MRSSLILTLGVVAALAGAPALVGSAAAADANIVAAGTTTFKVPGMGNCTSPTSLALKTSGTDFGFAALVQGGENGTNPCSLVNIYMAYSSQTPPASVCQSAPIGAVGQVQGPAKLTVKKSTYVVEYVVKDCANNIIRMVNTMTVSAASVTYTFQQFVNKGLNLIATGTLNRAPTG